MLTEDARSLFGQGAEQGELLLSPLTAAFCGEQLCVVLSHWAGYPAWPWCRAGVLWTVLWAAGNNRTLQRLELSFYSL